MLWGTGFNLNFTLQLASFNATQAGGQGCTILSPPGERRSSGSTLASVDTPESCALLWAAPTPLGPTHWLGEVGGPQHLSCTVYIDTKCARWNGASYLLAEDVEMKAQPTTCFSRQRPSREVGTLPRALARWEVSAARSASAGVGRSEATDFSRVWLTVFWKFAIFLGCSFSGFWLKKAGFHLRVFLCFFFICVLFLLSHTLTFPGCWFLQLHVGNVWRKK